MLDNTLIVYTSDNGPQLGSALPLRGKKAQTWEGGQRVPGIITYPKRFKGGKVSAETITTLDLFPTILKQIGALDKFEGNHIFDGRDISEHLVDTDKQLPEKPFYYFNRNGKLEAVRLGKWKLHVAKDLGWDSTMNGNFETALYDLDKDMGEQVNVANAHPELVKKLTKLMETFDTELEQQNVQ